MADEIMRQGVIGLADIVIKPGLINVDFADVRAVMDNPDPDPLSLTPTPDPDPDPDPRPPTPDPRPRPPSPTLSRCAP